MMRHNAWHVNIAQFVLWRRYFKIAEFFHAVSMATHNPKPTGAHYARVQRPIGYAACGKLEQQSTALFFDRCACSPYFVDSR